jgi:hypothetical protein
MMFAFYEEFMEIRKAVERWALSPPGTRDECPAKRRHCLSTMGATTSRMRHVSPARLAHSLGQLLVKYTPRLQS